MWKNTINSRLFLIFLTLQILTSCGVMHKSVKHGKLEVQTKMSETVFLDPVDDTSKTVYVNMRNTSGVSDFQIEQDVKNRLISKGYNVVDKLANANFILQANVLQVGKNTLENPFESLQGGYGASIQSAVAGAAIGGALGGNSESALIGGVLGGIAGTVLDAAVQVNQYTVITDLLISEKAKGEIVEESSEAKLKQGTSGYKHSKWKVHTDWKKYQTRIVSVAKKVNLKLDDALPELKNGIVDSIAGMF